MTETKRAPSKSTNAPKGHEAYLKGLEQSKATIRVEYLDDAPDDVGTIKTSDKYTISLRTHSGLDVVIYKHSIRRFYAVPKAQ